MFKKCFLAILSLISISNFLIAEIEYSIHDIGTLQTHESYAIAINNRGQILGWYNVDGSKEGKHFFVRNKDGIFHEVPETEPSSKLAIYWQYLTDDGKAYGTFDVNTATKALCVWDQYNGVTKLGILPGKEVVAINNAGQVLIKSVVEDENGKPVRRPVIWQNGQITKLKGLEGNLGIESDVSYGFAMNNKGEVVGQSLVSLGYKNEIYKQVHAVKWTNGQAIDIHNEVPKTTKTQAIAINDMSEILVSAGEAQEYLPKYLVGNDGKLTVFPQYDLNKLNNGYIYSFNYDYHGIFYPAGFTIHDKNGHQICRYSSINKKIQNDPNSIWMKVAKLISVNDRGEAIAQSETIYGEQHTMLLRPVIAN